MKSSALFLLVFLFSNIYAQDSVQINRINSLVYSIKHSTLPTQQDSTFKDYPGLGMSIKTYLKQVTFGKELKEYSQIVKTTQQENQTVKQALSGSAFYYDQNKLIKVEEFFLEEGVEHKTEWFFANDKCFFYTLKSDEAEQRIPLLLSLSKGFLKTLAGQQ